MELLLPLRGLGTNTACHLKTVTLVLLLVGLGPASGCITRSGQDAERVASKQGKEPEYHPQVKSKINFQFNFHNIIHPQDPYAPTPGQGAENVDGGHEEGEVQVRKQMLPKTKKYQVFFHCEFSLFYKSLFASQVGQKWEFPVAQTDVGNLWGTIGSLF